MISLSRVILSGKSISDIIFVIRVLLNFVMVCF